jgi:hypothetical protein
VEAQLQALAGVAPVPLVWVVVVVMRCITPPVLFHRAVLMRRQGLPSLDQAPVEGSPSTCRM